MPFCVSDTHTCKKQPKRLLFSGVFYDTATFDCARRYKIAEKDSSNAGGVKKIGAERIYVLPQTAGVSYGTGEKGVKGFYINERINIEIVRQTI